MELLQKLISDNPGMDVAAWMLKAQEEVKKVKKPEEKEKFFKPIINRNKEKTSP